MSARESATTRPHTPMTSRTGHPAATAKAHGGRHFEQMILPSIGFSGLIRYLREHLRRAAPHRP
jgi:hypothetical protein